MQAWWLIPAARCGLGRGAKTHLISSSFRAFRFATRCPGGRRGCCVGPCCSFHQQPASGSENRRSGYPRPPRAKGLPKGSAFPSLTAARDRQPSPAGGRRSALAQTDPPMRFFSSTGRGAFSFWRNQKGPPPRPARWGKEEQGSGRSFRRRRKRSLADFATTQWGAHPCGNNPLAGARPPRPPDGGPRLFEGTPFTSPFPPESGAPYSKRRISSSEIALLICDTASSSRTVPHS